MKTLRIFFDPSDLSFVYSSRCEKRKSGLLRELYSSDKKIKRQVEAFLLKAACGIRTGISNHGMRRMQMEKAHVKAVRLERQNWGWGVGDDMDDLLAEYGFAEK